MALVASGAIAFSDVNVELGFSSTATIALNDAAVRTLFNISSGQISMSDGYSKSASLGFVEEFYSTVAYAGSGESSGGRRIQNIEADIPLGSGSKGFLNSAGTKSYTMFHLTGDAKSDSELGTFSDVNGGISVSTGTKKYGTGSLYFDGFQRLNLTPRRKFNFEFDQWTCEFWIYPSSSSDCNIVRCGSGESNWAIKFSSGYFRLSSSGGNLFSATIPTANQWNHVALTNDGSGTLRYFLNGGLYGSGTTNFFTDPNDTPYFAIGESMDAYIDDFRWILGTPTYTSAGFTPPAAALTVQPAVTGSGGMVWIKNRTSSSQGGTTVHHTITDSTLIPSWISSSTTDASRTTPPWNNFGTFTGGGVSVGQAGTAIGYGSNFNQDRYVAFMFRKSQKFFDVVSYTGDGTAGRTIAHSLGSVPGCIMVKRTSGTGDWNIYHRSLGNGFKFQFDTNSYTSGSWNSTTPTSSVFTVNASADVNGSGQTYVAYLFAHDAGGYGLTGTDNIISCGSYTTDSNATATVTLGYEPQWILLRNGASGSDWMLMDSARGAFYQDQAGKALYPSSSSTEGNGLALEASATGFRQYASGSASATYYYVAVRRGLMKEPTNAREVFNTTLYTGNGSTSRSVNTTIWSDSSWFFHRSTSSGAYIFDRNRPPGTNLTPFTTDAESTFSNAWLFDVQNTMRMTSSSSYVNASGVTHGIWTFKRAAKFFDSVTFYGDGTGERQISHKLGVAPELVIVKNRTVSTTSWNVWCKHVQSGDTTYNGVLEQTIGWGGNIGFSSTGAGTMNSSTFCVSASAGSRYRSNANGSPYIAWMFATLAGVSKVGTYVGTGYTAQTINCGFTTGARFVMIKRTDGAGSWYVYDTARGFGGGTDPYLFMNTSGSEVTGTDYVAANSTGFVINGAAEPTINASGTAFMFLAIA